MNINVPPPAGAVQWEQVRTRLDQNGPFSNMYDTPLYRDAVWEQFSTAEYARRYAALRAKMRAEGLPHDEPTAETATPPPLDQAHHHHEHERLTEEERLVLAMSGRCCS